MDRFFLWFLSLQLVFFATPAVYATEEAELQFRRLQAAWIYNIARFIEYPDSATATHLEICVTGDHAADISGPLQQGVAGRSIQNRPLLIRQASVAELASCQLIYQTSGVIRGKQIAPEHGRQIWISAPGHIDSGHSLFSLRVSGNKLELFLNKKILRQSHISIKPSLLRLAKPLEDE